MENKCIIVLGMHRSGTSCLAGSLEDFGIFLGAVSRNNPYNTKGNNENLKIIELHNEILEYNGGNWSVPPKTVKWAREHYRKRDQIIEEYKNTLIWGFKDPRTLLTIDGWLDSSIDISLIGIFRNPVAVADSLHNRNRFSHKFSYSLWYYYNRVLLDLIKKYGFPLISFDREKQDFFNSVIQAASVLGFNKKDVKFSFYDKDLIHYTKSLKGVPLKNKILYSRLNRIAIK